MSMTETLTKAPPQIEVPVGQLATLGLIKVVERAIKKNGPVVTLLLPGARRMTILGRASHAAFWQDNPKAFHKDSRNPHSSVSMTRAVLGPTLLTARSEEWAEMRREMSQILGLSKTWFQRPLAEATQRLCDDLVLAPEVPLLEHCIAWAVRAICEPLIGQQALDETVRDLVHQLTSCFLGLLEDPHSSVKPQILAHYNSVMDRIAAEHGPETIASHVLEARGVDCTERDALRRTVGGLLVASLHINALSLFWALLQLAEQPDLQDQLATEAAPWALNPRRVVDTPLAFATVREAQRLRPVMAFVERQVATEVEIDGYSLQAGETVLFSPWLAQRGEDWPEPLQFNPENFAKGRKLARGSYFPFGIGPRICPGTNLVNQQLTFAVSGVTRALRFSPNPATRPGDIAPMFRVNLEPRGAATLIASAR